MKWYFFRVHKIFEDGSIEAHFDTAENPSDDVRFLSPDIADLPGPSGCLREGYVWAASELEAEAKVQSIL